MIDRRFYQQAIEKLGFRQKSYQQAFGVEGSPGNLALLDLADYAHAFSADTGNLSNDQLRELYGRRQAFFRIWAQLNLSNAEMELICKQALIRAAMRLSAVETGE